MIIQRRIRSYQQPLHKFMVSGGKRAIEIAHRRWGKDEIALAVTCELAHKRVASYWHCLPEFEQGRKSLWTAMNAHTGKRRIDEAFPPEVREATNDQSMFVKLRNGSTWQIVGSDRYDGLVGAGVAGIVFSEWALANPSAWGYMRPMLQENDGWAMFITTPRGHNHAKAMYDHALKTPSWFAEVSSVLETHALNQEQQDEAMAEYQAMYGIDVGRAQFEQEYLCSFNAAILGAYFGSEVSKAEREGRMQAVEIDTKHPVHKAWDLGKAVNNPIWCFQVIEGKPRIVDFYRPETDDIHDWMLWLKSHGYDGNDYVPHDILATEWGKGRTRVELLRSSGGKPTRLPMVSVADGRQAARTTINLAVFHLDDDERGERMTLGINGLKNYRREWDDELKTYRENPVKDWSEHIGSAFRYLGLAWREATIEVARKPETELEYTVGQDGVIWGNKSVKEAVEAMVRRRRRSE